MNRWMTLWVLCSAAQSWAGVTMVNDRAGSKSTVSMEGNKLRLETERSGRPMTVLFDGDAQKLWMLDDAAKSYRTIDPQTMQPARDQQAKTDAMASGQRAQADAQMQAALAQMPPERRAMVEAQMKQRQTSGGPAAPPTAGASPGSSAGPAPSIDYKATGQHKKVAGHECDTYRELQDGKPKADGCYIPLARLGLTKDDFKAIDAFTQFRQSHFGGMGGPALPSVTTAPGIPAERTELDDSGAPGTSSKMVSISTAKVPDDRFQLPAGYTEQKFGGPPAH
jgi:hypothetical protein